MDSFYCLRTRNYPLVLFASADYSFVEQKAVDLVKVLTKDNYLRQRNSFFAVEDGFGFSALVWIETVKINSEEILQAFYENTSL